jgi:hypothetical protein
VTGSTETPGDSQSHRRKLWYVQSKIAEDLDVTPILARTLTWAEIGDGASIIFDLRIAAVSEEPEPETRDRFVAEAIRLAGAFLLEQGK